MQSFPSLPPPWSRILAQREVIAALCANGTAPAAAHVTMDAGLHPRTPPAW